MWIMECREPSQELKMYDRSKLRPLMPRPNSEKVPIPHYWCLQNSNFLPWNQLPPPSNCLDDYGIKREIGNNTAPLVSSRWNPTPEQLQSLEEMYRRGIRTPSAEQIQQIAAKLRKFGKIEGKNVFYWFQNHKARERQRKRRHEMEWLAGKRIRHVDSTPTDRRQPSGLAKRERPSEIEHPKKLPTDTNSSTGSQYPASINFGAAAATVVKELDNEVLQQQQQAIAAKSTDTSFWQLDFSSCLSPNNSVLGQENSKRFAAFHLGNLLPTINDDDFGSGDDRTLQLFPVKGNGLMSTAEEQEKINNRVSSIGISALAPNLYFEFLPVKD